jgi:cell division protein FtsW
MNQLFKIKGDKIIWGIIIVLLLLSVLAVYSSTHQLLVRHSSIGILHFLIEQSQFVILGIFLIYIFHKIKINNYRRYAFASLLLSIILLLLAFIFPTENSLKNGVYRWIEIPIINQSFQPSDFAKIGLILYLSKVIGDNNFAKFSVFFIKVLLPLGTVCLLALIGGGTSTAILLGITSLCLMYISGIKMNFLGKTIMLILITLALLFMLNHIYPNSKFFKAFRLENVINSRLINKSNETIAHIEKAKRTIASGGLLGLGPGKKMHGKTLPNAYDDYIYAFIAEEYGIWGTGLILSIYLLFMYRTVLIVKKCKLKHSMVMVLGFSLLIVFQAMMHMFANVSSFFVTGQPLPLISRGGTSLLTMAISLGIILSVSRAADKNTSNISS